MAHVDKIWFLGSNASDKTMAVFVKLKPAGEVRVDVQLPDGFYDTVLRTAQLAADLHEQKMRAEMLGEAILPQMVPPGP